MPSTCSQYNVRTWVRRCVYTRTSGVQIGLTKPLSTSLYVHLHSIIKYGQIIIKFDPQSNTRIEAVFLRIVGPAHVTVEGAGYYLLPFVSGLWTWPSYLKVRTDHASLSVRVCLLAAI